MSEARPQGKGRPSAGRIAFGAAAVALIALGLFLRAHGLASHALWIDEYGTGWAVAGEGWGELVRRVLAVQGQSPLYYGIVKASVDLLGPGPLGLRAPSLLCGALLLALALPLARTVLVDRRMTLASLAAFALNERLVYYSQEARPYALALLLAGASFLAYASALRRPRSGGARAAWALATAAAFYAHYLFGVLALVQGLHWLRELRRGGVRLRDWLLPAGALGLAAAPGLVHLASLFGRRHRLDWVRSSGPAEALGVALGYADAPVLLATAGAAALAAAWAGLQRPFFARGARPGLALAWALGPFLAVSLLSLLLDVTLLHRRYLVMAVPAVALLYGILMGGTAARTRLAWLPLLVFLAAAAGLRLAPEYERSGLFSERHRSQHWSRAGERLREAHRPGEPIFYRTHFVELDAVVRGEAGAYTADFTTWPVAAHLRPGQREALRALPYRESAHSEAVLRERLHAALRRPRTWVIGMGRGTLRFARRAAARSAVEVARYERFGDVHLLLLQRDEKGPAAQPSPGAEERPAAGAASPSSTASRGFQSAKRPTLRQGR